MADIQFVGTYEGRSKNIGALRFVNMFPVLDNGGAIVSVFGTPGLTQFTDTGGDIVRGFYVFGTDLYGVAGGTFFKINNAGVITIISSALVTNSGNVDFACNGLEILFVDGLRRYVYNLGSSVFTITVDTATSCAYIDGAFLKNEAGTDFFYISDPYDGLTWNAIKKARCESDSDNLVRILTTFSTIFMLGERTTEIWYDAGSFPVQFERMQGGTMNIGCAAPFSAVRTGDTGNTVVWLAKNAFGQGFVVMSEGGAPVTISTQEIEFQIAQYSDIGDAVGYSYREDGNTFYVINFPIAGKTWCYNFTNGAWHERSSNDGRHFSHKYAYFNNKHIVSSYADGKIYAMDMDVYSDNGETIKRKIITPHIGDGINRFVYPFVQLDVEAGDGLISGQGSDPQVMIRFSNDRGHTWGNEHWVSLGKIGEYAKRAILRRTGTGFWRTYEFTFSDPIKIVVLNLKIQAQ